MELRAIIVRRSCDSEHHDHKDDDYREHEEHSGHNDFESFAEEFMSEDFHNYLAKHGPHFTDALAEYASMRMKNANGSTHSWSAPQVKKAITDLGYAKDIEHVSLGDLTYTANMAYADFFGDPIKDDAGCITYAHKVANDPDGYEGMIFWRWISDMIGKKEMLNWKNFI